MSLSLTSVIKSEIMGHLPHAAVAARLPATAAGYKYRSTFVKKTEIDPWFLYGIYTKGREKALAKMWYGKHKNMPYLTMKNEIYAYRVLTAADKKLQKEITTPVRIPTLVTWMEKEQSLMMLVKFINGETAYAQTLESQHKIFKDILAYFRDLTAYLPKKGLTLSKRRGISYIAIYPVVLVTACFANPRAAKELLLSIPVFLKGIPQIVGKQELFIAHRDLTFKNIMVEDSIPYPIDFEFCTLTIPYYDAARVVQSYWNQNAFAPLMQKDIQQDIKSGKVSRTYVRALMVYISTHKLIGRIYTKQRVGDFVNFLELNRKGKIV